MSTIAPVVREECLEVLEAELAGGVSASELAESVERLFGTLREATAKIVGEAGYAALLDRALHLTAQPHALAAAASGLTLDRALAERQGVPWVRAWASALFIEVLSLLASFIGEDLTLRLVRRAWRRN